MLEKGGVSSPVLNVSELRLVFVLAVAILIVYVFVLPCSAVTVILTFVVVLSGRLIPGDGDQFLDDTVDSPTTIA